MPTQEEANQYLLELRDSGQTNMFGARPYLESEFDIDSKEAGKLLTNWMKSFDD